MQAQKIELTQLAQSIFEFLDEISEEFQRAHEPTLLRLNAGLRRENVSTGSSLRIALLTQLLTIIERRPKCGFEDKMQIRAILERLIEDCDMSNKDTARALDKIITAAKEKGGQQN